MIMTPDSFEHTYYPGMDTVEHWWNGNWGRLFRRDVWLRTDGCVWQVEVKVGPNAASRDYLDQDEAREQVEELLRGRGPWSKVHF
jgi:hypothetical protein